MKSKNNIQNQLRKKIFREFTIEVILFSVIPLLILSAAFFVISRLDFQWLYNISPDTYVRLKSLFNYLYSGNIIVILVLAVLWITGIFILLYRLLGKVFSYVNAVCEAANQLFDKEVEYIELPPELEELGRQMNHMKRESEKNERMAKENEQRKNDLIVYLAHDIKTPLTSMIGYLSLLDEIDDMPQAQRKKYTAVALEKSYKLEDLINELFDITRFNSEKIILEKEEINLVMMMEQIIEDFYPVLKENNKEIEFIYDDKIILNGDSDKLARVFCNLIKNAVYYSTDSKIEIRMNKSGNNACIAVSNRGRKIPEEKLKRIFEKFYRVDSARTTKTGGSGLGLAIAKEIVELHGGTIRAVSDEKYTRFYVELPLNTA